MKTKSVKAYITADPPRATGIPERPFRYTYTVRILGVDFWAGYQPLRDVNFATEPPCAEDIIRDALKNSQRH